MIGRVFLVTVSPTGGLCSFYAERGGVPVGFEEM